MVPQPTAGLTFIGVKLMSHYYYFTKLLTNVLRYASDIASALTEATEEEGKDVVDSIFSLHTFTGRIQAEVVDVVGPALDTVERTVHEFCDGMISNMRGLIHLIDDATTDEQNTLMNKVFSWPIMHERVTEVVNYYVELHSAAMENRILALHQNPARLLIHLLERDETATEVIDVLLSHPQVGQLMFDQARAAVA